MGYFSVGYEQEGNLTCFPTAVLLPWWSQDESRFVPLFAIPMFGLKFSVVQGSAPLRTTLEPSKARGKGRGSKSQQLEVSRAEICVSVQLGS